jgi:hypothetical protein
VTTPQPDSLDLALDLLYDLDRDELRRLAWEALLISDGPDRIVGVAEGSVQVSLVRNSDLYVRDWWFTVSNPTEGL